MQEIAKALTWTFIHSLWQGLLAALLAAIIISSTRNATARLRYNLLGIVLILFVTGAIITFLTQWPGDATLVTVSSIGIVDEVQLLNSSNGLMDDFMVWVNGNSNTIVVIWTFFFFLSCLRLVTGVAAVNRLRHYKTQPVSKDWKTKLEQLQLMIGVRHSVSLLQSQLVKVPMALGILKPVILLPMGLITHLPPEQVETILLHELAHIRRRDYLVNLLQHIAEAIFFFNPAIRWISSLIRQEREASCDDLVVSIHKQKTSYLNALMNFQEYSVSPGFYAMGIGGKRHHLLNRVRRIITNKNNGVSLFEKIALLAGVFVFSAFSFVMKENETKIETFNTSTNHVELNATAITPIVPGNAEKPVVKKGKTSSATKTVIDTIPAKKDRTANRKRIGNNKRLPTLTQGQQASKDANAKLQEIIQLKDQIGQRKDTIGVIKEKLKTADGKEKEKMQQELKKERDELDGQRKVLDLKREQWDELKEKVKEKQVEQKNSAPKKITKPGKPATIKNDPDKSDKSDQWDKNDQWNKPDKWNESDQSKTINKKNIPFKTAPSAPTIKMDKPGIDVNKINKQTIHYQFEVKDPPPAKKVLPETIKKPVTPAKKSQPVRT